MNWLWAYFRRKTFEAIQAGVHDALSAGNGSGLSDEQATVALRALSGNTGASPSTDAPTPTPQLAAPSANGNSEPTEQPRRGPGRPRKFQEPPE